MFHVPCQLAFHVLEGWEQKGKTLGATSVVDCGCKDQAVRTPRGPSEALTCPLRCPCPITWSQCMTTASGVKLRNHVTSDKSPLDSPEGEERTQEAIRQPLFHSRQVPQESRWPRQALLQGAAPEPRMGQSQNGVDFHQAREIHTLHPNGTPGLFHLLSNLNGGWKYRTGLGSPCVPMFDSSQGLAQLWGIKSPKTGYKAPCLVTYCAFL